MVVAGAKIVSRDGEIFNEHLTVYEMTIGIVHAHFAQADGFDLRAKQDNARNEFFNKFVVETRSFVPDIDILLKSCLHLVNCSAKIAKGELEWLISAEMFDRHGKFTLPLPPGIRMDDHRFQKDFYKQNYNNAI